MVERKTLKVLFVITIFCLLFSCLSACSQTPANSNPATVTEITGYELNELSVTGTVRKDVDRIDFSNIVHTTDDTNWGLYKDIEGQTVIPTKIMMLENGDNQCYIIATSKDGNKINVYTVSIYRSFDVQVKYFDGSKLLYTDIVETNTVYDINYTYNEDGFTFNKWLNEDGQEYTSHIILNDENIYADAFVNKYNISFDSNGGTEVSQISQDYGSDVVEPETRKTGYTLLGWYEDGSPTPYNFNKIEARNIQLKALWDINDYSITFNSDGGSSVNKITQEYNTTVSSPNNPIKLGYTFSGWYEDNSATQYNFNKIEARDIVLIAKWQENDEMSNFYFSSDAITCEVYGIKNKNVTGIIVPDYVTSIAKRTFEHCDSIESVKIGNSVSSIGYDAFYDCDNLTSIEIPNSVKNIGKTAFFSCGNLLSVVIGDGVTSIGEKAFAYCYELKSVKIGVGLTSFGENVFLDCNKLESITLPFIGETLNGFYNTHFSYIFGAEDYSDNYDYVPTTLKEVTITGSCAIGNRAFYNCDSLEKITIGDNVTKIGSYSFHSCKVLKDVIIGNGVKTIGDSAFSFCDSLENVTIGKNVTLIDTYAFSKCESLANVYYYGTATDWSKISISGNNTCLTNALISYCSEND